jgi:hypothetical protein
MHCAQIIDICIIVSNIQKPMAADEGHLDPDLVKGDGPGTEENGKDKAEKQTIVTKPAPTKPAEEQPEASISARGSTNRRFTFM